MRLDRLRISSFKNLRNFSIDFDESSLTTVIVGRNGTGKSNLLEALVIIYRDLDLGAPPAFKYELRYNCRGHDVYIDADPERMPDRVSVIVDGEPVPYRQLRQRGPNSVLPTVVFGYYSGPSNRLEAHFETHQKRFYEALIRSQGKDEQSLADPLRPLFYARLVHAHFALLAFFQGEDEQMLSLLAKHLQITDLDSVLFVMRQPSWRSNQGDSRFWNARGAVQTLLSMLYKQSLAPLRLKQRIMIGFRQSKSLEHLYLYLKNKEGLQKVASHYPSEQSFFKALESTYISELISDVRVRVRVRHAEGSLTFRDLSEGEQQLLMVLGLLRFTREDEALFLLDEPDTHLNPAWSVQYLDLLQSVVGEQHSSHVIMSTHNPLVVAGLERSQVQLMLREEETGQITARYPEESPRGMGVAGLLTSDVYGLRSQLDLYTLSLIDQKRKLAIKYSLTEEERAELDRLNAQLADVDSSAVVRDPLYKPFVDAMTKIEQDEGLQASILTEQQQHKRDERAVQALRDLKGSETET